VLLVVLCSGVPAQAQTIVNKVGCQNPGATCALQITGVTSGNALIIGGYSFNNTWTLTDDNGSPVLNVAHFWPDSTYGLAVWSVLNAAAGTHNFNISGGATNSALIVWEISGIATSNAFDQSVTEQSSIGESTPATGPTSATTTANQIVIGFIHGTNPGTYTAGGSFGTDIIEVNDGTYGRDLASEAKVVASTGAQTADYTTTFAVVHDGVVVTYSTTSIGGGATHRHLTTLGVGQ
jgi:hypothetical protein